MEYSVNGQSSIVVASQHIASCTVTESDIIWPDDEAKERQATARRVFRPIAQVIKRLVSSAGLANPRVDLVDMVRNQTDVYLAIVVTMDRGEESFGQVLEDLDQIFRQTEDVLSSLSTYAKPAEVAIEPGATITHAGDGQVVLAPKCVADLANGVREAAASSKGRRIDAAIQLATGDEIILHCRDPAICSVGDEVLRSDGVRVDGVLDSEQAVVLIFDRRPDNARSATMKLSFDDDAVRGALCKAQDTWSLVSVRWMPYIERKNGTMVITGGEVVAVESAGQRPLDWEGEAACG
ncbi:hypothetical protein [Thioalkalivibrio sp. AKL12]|uniref:hypothetical protein n=1 Tax=Thioalkalivibrio sp. AKL12 TaxID=1158159 RepID=UPI000369BD20|nr:hypothetical protein [Thioalkalivibrio sp. AKL12]